jgi:hypothetical protein
LSFLVLTAPPTATAGFDKPAETSGSASSSSSSAPSESGSAADAPEGDHAGQERTDEERARDTVSGARATTSASLSSAPAAPVPAKAAFSSPVGAVSPAFRPLEAAGERDDADSDEADLDDDDAEDADSDAKQPVRSNRAATGGAASASATAASDAAATTRAAYAPIDEVEQRLIERSRETELFNLESWRPSPPDEAIKEAVFTARFIASGGAPAKQGLSENPTTKPLAEAAEKAQSQTQQIEETVFGDRLPILGPYADGSSLPPSTPGALGIRKDHALPVAVAEFFVERYHAGGGLEVAALDRGQIRNDLKNRDLPISQYYQAIEAERKALKSLKDKIPKRRGLKPIKEGRFARDALTNRINQLSNARENLVENLFKISRDYEAAMAGIEVFKSSLTNTDRANGGTAVVLGEGANGRVFAVIPEGAGGRGRRLALKAESRYLEHTFTEDVLPKRHAHGVLRSMATRAIADTLGLGDMVMRAAPAILVEQGDGDDGEKPRFTRPAQINQLVQGRSPIETAFQLRTDIPPATAQAEAEASQNLNYLRGQIAQYEAERDKILSEMPLRHAPTGEWTVDILKANDNNLFDYDKKISDARDAFQKDKASMGKYRRVEIANGEDAVYERVDTRSDIVDINDARIQQLFNRMEVIDFITGQGDRNVGNYLLATARDETGREAVVGLFMIDSDASFGAKNAAPPNMIPTEGAVPLPQRIDFGLGLRILAEGFDSRVSQSARGLITSGQRQAMEERINELRAVLRSPDGRIDFSKLVLGPGETLETHSEAIRALSVADREAVQAFFADNASLASAPRWGIAERVNESHYLSQLAQLPDSSVGPLEDDL